MRKFEWVIVTAIAVVAFITALGVVKSIGEAGKCESVGGVYIGNKCLDADVIAID